MNEVVEELELREKEPGFGQVTVLVGPDGGGKSTLAQELIAKANERDEDPILIKGTRPNEWPISDQEKEKLAKLQKGYPDDDFKLYGLLSLACHHVVLELVKEGKNVIVDSEPTFKWLTWEALKNNLDKALEVLTKHKLNAVLPGRIIYVTPNVEDLGGQAQIIWNRLLARDQQSEDDPKDLGEVKERLEASEQVLAALKKLGVAVERKSS